MTARTDGWNNVAVPFPVIFRDDDWHNASTGEALAADVHIAGWKPWVSETSDA